MRGWLAAKRRRAAERPGNPVTHLETLRLPRGKVTKHLGLSFLFLVIFPGVGGAQFVRLTHGRGSPEQLICFGVTAGVAGLMGIVVAATSGALALVADRRTGLREALLLSRLSQREVLQGEMAFPLLTAWLVPFGLAFGYLFQPIAVMIDWPPAWPDLSLVTRGPLLEVAAMALACASAVRVSGFLGLHLGLWLERPASAAAAACALSLVCESLLVVASVATIRCIGIPLLVHRAAATPPWQVPTFGAVSLCGSFALANILLAAALWHSCIRALSAPPE